MDLAAQYFWAGREYRSFHDIQIFWQSWKQCGNTRKYFQISRKVKALWKYWKYFQTFGNIGAFRHFLPILSVSDVCSAFPNFGWVIGIQNLIVSANQFVHSYLLFKTLLSISWLLPLVSLVFQVFLVSLICLVSVVLLVLLVLQVSADSMWGRAMPGRLALPTAPTQLIPNVVLSNVSTMYVLQCL